MHSQGARVGLAHGQAGKQAATSSRKPAHWGVGALREPNSRQPTLPAAVWVHAFLPTPAAVAWSVHNRLVDAFEATQQYWKCVRLQSSGVWVAPGKRPGWKLSYAV